MSLDLSHTEVAGMQLQQLKQLTALQHLNLSDTDVTDAGLLQLEGFQSLRSLGVKPLRGIVAPHDAFPGGAPGLD